MWKNKSLPNPKTANVLSLWMRRKNAAKSLGELQEAETSGWLLTIWDMHALPIHTFSSTSNFPQLDTFPTSFFPQRDTFPQPARLFPLQLLLNLHQHPSSASTFPSETIFHRPITFSSVTSPQPVTLPLLPIEELTKQTGCWWLCDSSQVTPGERRQERAQQWTPSR